ncbi:formylglycine-generating enzyme family protein [Marinicellulosiphila megalodicopiae]|uniref:formylglycine-generating enzyme family protein n=1 Tax=Marinicellulosiphila megalodicopiae TaxID=2724896 RepID=UPI003BB0F7CA
MHTQKSLNIIKNHHEPDIIAPGLLHISKNVITMDNLIADIEKHLDDNFRFTNKYNQQKIHFHTQEKTLDYTNIKNPHFYIIQSIKALVEKEFSFFLFKPLLNDNIFALLIIANQEFETFIQSNGLWFDKHFSRLQDDFDGFSELNNNIKTENSSEKLIQQSREEYVRQTQRADRITNTSYFMMAVLIVALSIGTYIIYLNITGKWEIKSKQFTHYLTQFSNKEKNPYDQLNQYVGNLVPIPTGSFMMGHEDKDFLDNSSPKHNVTLNSFLMMETELTFAHWDLCVKDNVCSEPDDNSWGRGQKPVINISYNQITQQYIPWLYSKTGYRFTLPSESQWEYAARGGTQTKYSFGDDINCNQAHFGFNGNHRTFDSSNDCLKESGQSSSVKQYPPNEYGLYDMHGNVAELVADQFMQNYEGAPTDGSIWYNLAIGEMYKDNIRPVMAVTRGGYFGSSKNTLHVARRDQRTPSNGMRHTGFRLALNEEIED